MTLTSTAPQADDLGFLLHKHPGRVHSRTLPMGTATVFFPRADAEVCTAALLVEVDSGALARSKAFRSTGFELADFFGDRPYAASSLLSVALHKVFGSAMAGDAKERPELVDAALPLAIHLPCVPSRGGADLTARLFGPLGWDVDATPIALDAERPEWGISDYVDLRLSGTMTVRDALWHLYVLLPVLDDAKHYWVADGEVDKLIRGGGAWLGTHPERELITARYLAHQRAYVRDATDRLADGEDTAADADRAGAGEPEPGGAGAGQRHWAPDIRSANSGVTSVGDSGVAPTPSPRAERSGDPGPSAAEAAHSGGKASELRSDVRLRGLGPGYSLREFRGDEGLGLSVGGAVERVPLARARRDAIVHVLKSAGARTVVDLGTGEGQLVKALLSDPRFTEVTGADVSLRELDRAERVIGVTRLPDQVAQRLTLLQTSLTYTDDRLAGKDAAVLSEVIEHIDPDRLPAVERSVFGAGHRTVIVTTPNVEYNALYEGLAPDEPRHHDHRFEWDRRQFREWAARVGTQYGYTAEFRAIGTPSEDLGAPTQMAVFTRAEGER